MTRWICDLVILGAICAITGGLVQIRTGGDRQIERNRGIIRYGPRVPLEEAERLWDFLNRHQVFTGETIVVRLSRRGPTNEITFVVVPEFVENVVMRDSLTAFSQTLCAELYPHEPVRVLIANNELETLGILLSPQEADAPSSGPR